MLVPTVYCIITEYVRVRLCDNDCMSCVSVFHLTVLCIYTVFLQVRTQQTQHIVALTLIITGTIQPAVHQPIHSRHSVPISSSKTSDCPSASCPSRHLSPIQAKPCFPRSVPAPRPIPRPRFFSWCSQTCAVHPSKTRAFSHRRQSEGVGGTFVSAAVVQRGPDVGPLSPNRPGTCPLPQSTGRRPTSICTRRLTRESAKGSKQAHVSKARDKPRVAVCGCVIWQVGPRPSGQLSQQFVQVVQEAFCEIEIGVGLQPAQRIAQVQSGKFHALHRCD